MSGEVKKVNEDMGSLQVRLQTQYFEQDRQEQNSHKDSVRIYGIPEPENDHTRENTNDIIVKLANDIGVKNLSHRKKSNLYTAYPG